MFDSLPTLLPPGVCPEMNTFPVLYLYCGLDIFAKRWVGIYGGSKPFCRSTGVVGQVKLPPRTRTELWRNSRQSQSANFGPARTPVIYRVRVHYAKHRRAGSVRGYRRRSLSKTKPFSASSIESLLAVSRTPRGNAKTPVRRPVLVAFA